MNKVSVLGRFVKPVVLKNLRDDRYVINNILAISRKRKVEGQQSADFIPVVMWGQVAKVVEQYCQKGNLIGVSGRLISRQYLNEDNKQLFVVELVAEEVHLVEGKRYNQE